MRSLGGFSLVELLVSVALLVILLGSATYVFMQSQEIHARTVSQMEVDRTARAILDNLDRDLTNVVKTHEMEFFTDAGPNPSGHYEDGEVKLAGQTLGPLGAAVYHHALTLKYGRYTDPEGVARRSDVLYFKTVQPVLRDVGGGDALVDSEVLVAWSLDTGNPEYPVLRRQSQWMERTSSGAASVSAVENEPVGEWVTAFEVQVLEPTPNVVSGDARGTSGPLVYRALALSEVATSPAFQACHPGAGSPPPTATGDLFRDRELLNCRTGDAAAKMLKGVNPGDPFYMFQAGADTGQQLTIKAIANRASAQLTFIEPITLSDPAGDPDNYRTRAGYLPPALRVVLHLRDERSTQDQTVTREFRLPSR
ncbi:MAG: prepilin-type N-terminal cleavage/methylation domain-containing protein [Planctomycetes bacterium]|nr:prepilin-type N-terminal cleavage/methylation domain-containing protein [Planctomycetota bacterium]